MNIDRREMQASKKDRILRILTYSFLIVLLLFILKFVIETRQQFNAGKKLIEQLKIISVDDLSGLRVYSDFYYNDQFYNSKINNRESYRLLIKGLKNLVDYQPSHDTSYRKGTLSFELRGKENIFIGFYTKKELKKTVYIKLQKPSGNCVIKSLSSTKQSDAFYDWLVFINYFKKRKEEIVEKP